MKLRVQTAMVGVAAAMLFGCSSPPEDGVPSGGAGTKGAAGTGAAGTGNAAAGTTGSAGTGSAVAGTTGSAGTGNAATAGTTGTAGTGSATAGTTGTAGTGTGSSTCPTGVKGHCGADTAAAPTYPGYTLALVEEFDTPIDLDNDPIWTWSDGGPPEGGARFQKKGITFANGTMIITATGEKVPESTSWAEPDQDKINGKAAERQVSSGEFRTRYNNYRYGRYEVRFKAPAENGTKPATQFGNYLSTMFIFRTPKWQDWNEIDIELEAHIKGRVAYNMINAQNQFNYPGGDAGSLPGPGANFSIKDTHTYAFEWTPTKVTWYVDGGMLRSNMGNTQIPKLSAKIMMNLWVFGNDSAFGIVGNNVYPFSATYEWFRFYKSNTETTYPYENPKTQLPAGDTDFSKNNAGETVYP